MGVKCLWKVLEPVKHTVSLAELGHVTLAVDLSCWICQARSVKASSGYLPSYHYLKVLFSRITKLMQYGIRLIFVIDGKAPDIKHQTILERKGCSAKGYGRDGSRDRFINSSCIEKAKRLLDYLGLPYIQSDGEAEALCAQLNKQGVVNGCITEDNDALLYGATEVYRCLDFDKYDVQASQYKACEILSELNLSRQGLVVMALLIGCDYDKDGVWSVGPEAAMQLTKDWQAKYGDAILDRLVDWRDNKELKKLSCLKSNLGNKDKHCSQCHHPGSLVIHRKCGCDVCITKQGCEKVNPIPCPCQWHDDKRVLTDNALELSIRDKALVNKSFPNKEIISEYMTEKDDIPLATFTWKRPIFTRLIECCTGLLQFDALKSVSSVIYLLAALEFQYGPDEDEHLFTPQIIQKSVKRHFKDCLLFTCAKLADDKWTKDNEYTLIFETNLVRKRYPIMVDNFLKISAKGKKRRLKDDPDNDKNQTKLTNFFNVVKNSNSKKIAKEETLPT